MKRIAIIFYVASFFTMVVLVLVYGGEPVITQDKDAQIQAINKNLKELENMGGKHLKPAKVTTDSVTTKNLRVLNDNGHYWEIYEWTANALSFDTSAGGRRFYFAESGSAYADTSWLTFSPDILEDDRYKAKKREDITAKEYLEWVLDDVKKPIKPYSGIPDEQSERDKYSKDIAKIAIGLGYWAEAAEQRIKDLEARIKELEEK